MDILRQLETLTGHKAVFEIQASQGDDLKTQADISKAHTELGYTPKIGLHEGLKHLLEWVRDDLKIDPPSPTK
jgi:UDP-glucuronate 4-epimerase